MPCRIWSCRCVWGLLPLLLLRSPEAAAQVGGGGAATVQGVYVDAEGVLRTVVAGEEGNRLAKIRKQAAAERVSGAVAAKSPMRKVSLGRLAQEVKALVQSGERVPDEMRYLAGIQQVRYLFVYPEEKDLVIAGPAEGWATDPAGRVLGQSTKRPVVWLDDLVVTLRIFSPGGQLNRPVGCSINHTQEGLRQLNEYVASLGRSLDRRQVNAALIQGVRNSLGLQNIELFGAPADSRLAMVLIEADYRMKLVGIGLEDPRVPGLKSYVSMLGAGSGGTNKLQRWWFVPDYEAILESAEGNAFEFQGQRAKLLSADDAVKATGEVERKDAADPINKRFAQSFTKHYEELARVNPIFAELQNAFDLIILAALLEDRGLFARADSDLDIFLDPRGYSPQAVTTPKQVESVVNARFVGNKLAIPVGGGVIVEPSKCIGSQPGKPAEDKKLREQRQGARTDRVAAHRWWWD